MVLVSINCHAQQLDEESGSSYAQAPLQEALLDMVESIAFDAKGKLPMQTPNCCGQKVWIICNASYFIGCSLVCPVSVAVNFSVAGETTAFEFLLTRSSPLGEAEFACPDCAASPQLVQAERFKWSIVTRWLSSDALACKTGAGRLASHLREGSALTARSLVCPYHAVPVRCILPLSVATKGCGAASAAARGCFALHLRLRDGWL
eukprot:361612-Chlamydomonas_euryale.AAC.5